MARVAFVAAVLTLALPAGAADRAETADVYRWNLADIYPSEADWSAARDDLVRRIPGLAAHRGRLGTSATSLADALDAMYGLSRDLERIYVYAASLSDEDVRAAHPREMRDSAQQIAVQLEAATSFVRPEILAIDPEKVRAWSAAEPRLATYRFFLDDVLRAKPHTLSAGEERIVAEAQSFADTGGTAYGILSNADLPWPTVKLSSGEVRLDPSGYGLARAAPLRADREAVFTAFFGALKTYSRTIGATLDGQVKAQVFQKKVRGVRSPRSRPPSSTPTSLPRSTGSSSPTSGGASPPSTATWSCGAACSEWRSSGTRTSTSRWWEACPSSSPRTQARAITLEAFAPLGSDYVATLRKGYASRWTDYLPSTGKRSGAYSTGVYGVHPYQLLNFNGQYEDLSTLAHESGHSMHTWYAMASQPYPTYDYPIFVAEVASTLNENLLLAPHAREGQGRRDPPRAARQPPRRGARTTLFRQTQFAEFELAIHERAERGEPLTGENLGGALPEDRPRLLRPRQGCDPGRRPDRRRVGLHPPLLLRPFYVYQYATSMVASTALAAPSGEDSGKGEDRGPRTPTWTCSRAGGSQLPHRPAPQRGRRHDHLRPVRRGHRRDERDHGRDGEDPGSSEAGAAGEGLATGAAAPRRPWPGWRAFLPGLPFEPPR